MKKRPCQLLPPRSSAVLPAFLAAALALLAAGPAAAQAPAGKRAPVEAEVAGDRVRFRGADGLIFSEAELSDNFAIYYNPDDVSQEYVTLLRDNLEESWVFFQREGYRHPAFADRNRLAVYIYRDLDWAVGFYRVDAVATDPYLGVRPYDVRDAGDRDSARNLCTHEFFHFIQHAYDNRQNLGIWWLWEATATWSEDERIPNVSRGGYLKYADRWYDLWNRGTPLNTFRSEDPNLAFMPYGSAIYFKYLTEHHPSGADLMRRIWEQVGGNGMDTVRAVLGGDQPFRDLFADFGVAAFLKTHAPWNFRRGGEIGPAITPRLSAQGWYLDKWDAAAGRIDSREITVEPFCVSYIELIAPEGQAQATRLQVVVEPQGGAAGLVSKVVRLSGSRDAPHPVGVDVVPPAEGGSGHLIVEDYGFWPDRTWRTFLALANATASPIRVNVAAAVSAPPVLWRLTALEPSMGLPFYTGTWEARGDDRRELVARTSRELKFEKGKVEPFRITAEFSREIAGSPALHVAGRSIPLEKAPGVSGDWFWRADVTGLRLSQEALKRRTLPIRVEGASPDGLKLDANPASRVQLNPQQLRWDGYDPAGGGPDGTHILRLEKDLDGLWRSDDNTTIRIKHRDPAVDGFTMNGKPFFFGFLNERQITGKMKVRYPPEWRRRCPLPEEHSAALEMTVSEDKDTLNGRFELRYIDEQCNESSAGWKQFTLQRVPEEEAKALGR